MRSRRQGSIRPAGPVERGFTLIELLLVVALIAIASGLATLALRLSALLESARAEARALGLAATWKPIAKDTASPGAADFRFDGLPATDALPTHWLAPGVIAQVVGAPALVLGPEPMIGAQRVVLRLDDQHTALATDGLGPFVVVADGEPGASR